MLMQQIKAQETTQADQKVLLNQRLSLQRNIESDKKYIEDYSNLVYSEDIKIVAIKNEVRYDKICCYP